VFSFTTRPLRTQRKDSRLILDRRLGGHQNWYGRRREVQNLAPTEDITQTPWAASPCTDCPIPTKNLHTCHKKRRELPNNSLQIMNKECFNDTRWQSNSLCYRKIVLRSFKNQLQPLRYWLMYWTQNTSKPYSMRGRTKQPTDYLLWIHFCELGIYCSCALWFPTIDLLFCVDLQRRTCLCVDDILTRTTKLLQLNLTFTATD
jgi:hypothetical protein